MKRCFIGIRITSETKTRLLAAQEDLARLPTLCARRVRLVPSENFHATIKFLGATADDEVPALIAALTELARETKPFSATLAGFGAFPTLDRPRAVFAALAEGRKELVALSERVEALCCTLNYPPESRPRVPHVTIARVDQAKPRGPLTDWLRAAPTELLGSLDASALVVFESVRGPTSSRYVPLAELAIGG